MALSNKHRWIMVGSLVVRNHVKASNQAPAFDLSEVMAVAQQRITDDNPYRAYGSNQSRLMWFSNFDSSGDYYRFLVEAGDKEIAGVSWFNYMTRRSRDIDKEDDEGGHYTSHILIQKRANDDGSHLILAEKVPGVHFSSIKDHFKWLYDDDRFKKEYRDEKGKVRINRPIFEIYGHQSNTIRDALNTGRLQDVEFVKYQTTYEGGLDEDGVVREIVHQARWDVKRSVTEEEARSVFRKIPAYFERFRQDAEDAHMFVRIKTGSGQIKSTEIQADADAILEQAFVHNEFVTDFDRPLAQRHAGLRQDMLAKMIALAESAERTRH